MGGGDPGSRFPVESFLPGERWTPVSSFQGQCLDWCGSPSGGLPWVCSSAVGFWFWYSGFLESLGYGVSLNKFLVCLTQLELVSRLWGVHLPVMEQMPQEASCRLGSVWDSRLGQEGAEVSRPSPPWPVRCPPTKAGPRQGSEQGLP